MFPRPQVPRLPAAALCLILLHLAIIGALSHAQEENDLFHIVSLNETLTSIADLYGVSVADLISRNAIADPDALSVGKRLLVLTVAELAARDRPNPEEPPSPQAPVAVGGGLSAEALAAAAVTPADAPKRDPSDLRSILCVTVFEDDNANGILDIDEALLSGAVTIVLDEQGAETARLVSDESQKQCQDLPPDAYALQATAPAGYGLTTPPQLRIALAIGRSLDLKIGAKRGRQTLAIPPPRAQPVAPTAPTDEGETSVLLGLSGLLALALAGIVLLSGLGLALFLRAR